MTDWPENVLRLANAIRIAENSPIEWNNPGSLKSGDAGGFQLNGVGNAEGVVKFVNADDGWDALCVKINRILAGRSLTYPLSMTLAEMGMRYSGNDPNWAVNVARELGVSQDITLADLALSNT